MARIWQEGFESPFNQFTISKNGTSTMQKINSGRHSLSKGCMETLIPTFAWNNGVQYAFGVCDIPGDLTEFYSRIWIYLRSIAWEGGTTFPVENHIIKFRDATNANLISIRWMSLTMTTSTFALYVNGVLIGNFIIPYSNWTKLDFYLKSNATTGAYTFKVNDIVLYTATGVNTGIKILKSLYFGSYETIPQYDLSIPEISIKFDDLAINDTTGVVNNSWCGSGTIFGLKPKNVGNKSQFNESYGKYRVAKTGTGVESLKIPTHGLSTNDYIKNTSRTNTYSAVTKVDDDTLTTTSIASQAKDDVVSLYKYSSNVSAIAGTNTTTIVTTNPHGLLVGDVIYNVTRGVFRYVTVLLSTTSVTISSAVTSQTSGDSINLYPIKTDHPHWSVLEYPSPSASDGYIKTDTSSDIDTFDMENLIDDVLISSSSTIVSVSEHIKSLELGAGTQIKPVLRIGIVDYEGATIDLLNGEGNHINVYNTSPATSSPFSISEIDAIEAGVKLV